MEIAIQICVLLNPLKEQFHLPARPVQIGNGEGRQLEVIGQEDEELDLDISQTFATGELRERHAQKTISAAKQAPNKAAGH